MAVPELWDCRAVVFDTDGVITDSARAHATAWKEAFDAVPGVEPPFDQEDDYRRYVDGKSRLDGAAAFFAARNMDLPYGEPDEAPGTDSVCAVAAMKDKIFMRVLDEGVLEAYPGTVRLMLALQSAHVPCAAISSSRHARDLIEHAGVRPMLETVVDGNDVASLGLAGKPDPALFLEAARRLSVPAGSAAIVEDALSGVEAGRRGGFGLVVGVDRTASATSADDLRAHGADIVVRDLGELVGAASEGDGG
ncbi:HAD family hydrolase [Streptomyces avicenniae]|uniref:HAD family hydrolase n=1 Tax=Streptomyces avicenniae TaxID=500153 RepID=UPI00069C8195|nr:HAD-IA family hydrolase [Streptomyces avicenniae]